MSTFAGMYIKEPSAFGTVTTESALIQVADDPEAPVVPADVTAWSELTVPQAAALVATMDPIIVRKEGIVNGYLRAGGFLVPMDIDRNPVVLDYAVRLVWNDLRYRKQQLSDEEYRTANSSVLTELAAIARGDIVLDAPPIEGEAAPTGAVHAASSAPRIFSRTTLEEF